MGPCLEGAFKTCYLMSMPWEKQFERDEVLEKAMQAFWQHGYDGTSMKDLIACMGINPGSIYATFGDKKNLYCQALEYYQHQSGELFADYEEKYSPRRAILALFEKIADDVRRGPEHRTCFLVNAVIEAAPKDQAIDKVAKTCLSDFEVFLQKLIKAGQDEGEIDPSLDVPKTSHVLLALIVGERVLARGHLADDAFDDFVSQVDKILG